MCCSKMPSSVRFPAERPGFPKAFELKKLLLGGDLECQVPLSPIPAPDTSHSILHRDIVSSPPPTVAQPHPPSQRTQSSPPIGNGPFSAQASQNEEGPAGNTAAWEEPTGLWFFAPSLGRPLCGRRGRGFAHIIIVMINGF
jgi:hypothetical protein